MRRGGRAATREQAAGSAPTHVTDSVRGEALESPVDRGAGSTRERILAAAVAEFGARGYAGARTASIAARAGVNAQLITYYFGGKQGLLDELRGRWSAKQAELTAVDSDFRASFAAHLRATLAEPDWSRLVIWQALGDAVSSADASARRARQHRQLRAGVARVRARQRAGELSGNIDAEFVVLLAYAVAFAPIALPHVVSALFGDKPGAYQERWVEQLARLVEHQASAA